MFKNNFKITFSFSFGLLFFLSTACSANMVSFSYHDNNNLINFKKYIKDTSGVDGQIEIFSGEKVTLGNGGQRLYISTTDRRKSSFHGLVLHDDKSVFEFIYLVSDNILGFDLLSNEGELEPSDVILVHGDETSFEYEVFRINLKRKDVELVFKSKRLNYPSYIEILDFYIKGDLPTFVSQNEYGQIYCEQLKHIESNGSVEYFSTIVDCVQPGGT